MKSGSMTRYPISKLLLAAAVSGSALLMPFVTAPVAQANCNANSQWDPVNRTCWTKQDRNSMGASNGCRPGELGGCLGALQNATRPGATLPGKEMGESTGRPGGDRLSRNAIAE